MLQDFNGHPFRLGGCDIKFVSIALKTFQQCMDTRVGMIFESSNGYIPAAIEFYSFRQFVLRNTKTGERFCQRRSDNGTQLCFRRCFNSVMCQYLLFV